MNHLEYLLISFLSNASAKKYSKSNRPAALGALRDSSA